MGLLVKRSNCVNINKFALLILIITLFACTACGKRLTLDELKNSDFGPYPNNYEEIIKAYYSNTLFDPYSAQYTFEEPIKRYVRAGEIFGWAVCGTINAKNRFGGYVGAERYWVMISYGEVKRDFTDFLAEAACKTLYKERFE